MRPDQYVDEWGGRHTVVPVVGDDDEEYDLSDIYEGWGGAGPDDEEEDDD